MNRQLYDMFERVRNGTCLSSSTIHALRDYFFGYVDALDEHSLPLELGEPPFSQFTDWVARKHGKSKKGLSGKWTRWDGGWWRLFEMECGSQEEAFTEFFRLLDEFRRRRANVIAKCDCDKIKFAESQTEWKDGMPEGMRAIQYVPDEGLYLYFVHGDGSIQEQREQRYFGTLADLFGYAWANYHVPNDSWTILET